MNDEPLPVGSTGESTSPPPPGDIGDQRELFFPSRPTRIHSFDFGVALGITATIFLLFSVVVVLLGRPANLSSMAFFADILPGFDLTFKGIIVGVLWSAVGGFLFGTLAGLFYNWRLRRYVL